jgi:hypothetical protein
VCHQWGHNTKPATCARLWRGLPQLNSLFGEHTFFLDSHGLNIVEPAEAGGSGAQSAKVVNVANWSDADPNRLEPHEPEPTDVVVTLGSKH